MKRKIIITFLATFSLVEMKAQDIHFSQFFVNPLLINPAFAGGTADIEAGMQYRNQWQSMQNGFKTFAFSGSMNLMKGSKKKAFFGIGLNTFTDQAGDGKMKTLKMELPLVCHVNLNAKNTLGAGYVIGFGQRSISAGNLTWASQYDGMAYNPSLNSGEADLNNSFSYLDMGAGISWIYNGVSSNVSDYAGITNSFGVSMLHVNQPGYSFFGTTDEKLQPRIVVYENMQIDFKNSKLALIPTFITQIQGPSMEIAAGLLAKYYIKPASKMTGLESGASASFGMIYRNKDAIIVTTMFNYSSFGIGFSYDMNISGLSAGTQGRGGYELSLKYIFNQPGTVSGRRSF